MRKNPAKNRIPPWKNRIPLSFSEKIQRTVAFKKFKEQNFEKLRAEIEAEAALQDKNLHDSTPEKRVLLRAFANTPEGLEVERQIEAREEKRRLLLRRAQTWRFFCWEIILRSDIFLKWCRRKRILPWPIFNLDYCPPRVLINPAVEKFCEFLATKAGRRATDRLQEHKHIWPHLYEKKGIRGFGVKNLMPPDDYKRPVNFSPSYSTTLLSELTPDEKALKAWDFHHFMEKDLMEITRRLFPHTEGKHPSYDEETNRCLQQVKRWSAKVDELIRLVDTP
jgi:hypothetical protein